MDISNQAHPLLKRVSRRKMSGASQRLFDQGWRCDHAKALSR
jgi:hypothetical protein